MIPKRELGYRGEARCPGYAAEPQDLIHTSPNGVPPDLQIDMGIFLHLEMEPPKIKDTTQAIVQG